MRPIGSAEPRDGIRPIEQTKWVISIAPGPVREPGFRIEPPRTEDSN